MTEDTIKRRARGLDRAFDILDFLKEIGQPLRPNDIASGIGSPKSTVYELVASLLERRILEPVGKDGHVYLCLLYTSPSPRDGLLSRMPSSA